MTWFEDAWNWTRNAVSDVADVVKKGADAVSTVLPYIAPLLLKKGGQVKEFRDTQANRKKVLSYFNKHHKTKVSMALFNKIVNAKGKHPKLKLKAKVNKKKL